MVNIWEEGIGSFKTAALSLVALILTLTLAHWASISS